MYKKISEILFYEFSERGFKSFECEIRLLPRYIFKVFEKNGTYFLLIMILMQITNETINTFKYLSLNNENSFISYSKISQYKIFNITKYPYNDLLILKYCKMIL